MAKRGSVGTTSTVRTTGRDKQRIAAVQRYLQMSRGLPIPPSVSDVIRYALLVAGRLVRRRVQKRALRRKV